MPTCELSSLEAASAVAGERASWAWAGTSPVLAAIAHLGTALLGPSELGVRYFAPFLALAASYVVWRLARSLHGPRVAAWSVVVLNVLPAFNIAAVTLTPASVAFAGYACLAECLRGAMLDPRRWRPAWAGAAVCVVVLSFADGWNVLALWGVLTSMAAMPALRSRLSRRPEFWSLIAVWLVSAIGWLAWWRTHCGVKPILLPDWRMVPGIFRCLLLVTPLLVWALLRQAHGAWRAGRWRGMEAGSALLLSFALPLFALDVGWGVWRAWPDLGLSAWSLFGVVFLARFDWQFPELSLRRRVAWRTVSVAIAALQSALLMCPDQIRSAGVPRRLAQRVDVGRTYSRFLTADPSSDMNGWREAARLVGRVIESFSSSPERPAPASRDRVLLFAERWQLAAPVMFYLGRQSRADVLVTGGTGLPAKVEREHRGGSGIYITDDARAKKPPESVARVFESSRVISVAQLMHGGHQVRALKIFACHSLHAHDL